MRGVLTRLRGRRRLEARPSPPPISGSPEIGSLMRKSETSDLRRGRVGEGDGATVDDDAPPPPSLPSPSRGEDFAHSLAFGIERIGLVSLRRPVLVGVAALMLLALAVAGVMRLEVDDSIGQLFRSETPAFRQYEAAS